MSEATSPWLVGYDGSGAAERALDVTSKLVDPAGAKIVLCVAVSSMSAPGGRGLVTLNQPRDAIAEGMLAEATSGLAKVAQAAASEASSVSYESMARLGSPSQVLLAAAEEQNAAMVVVGSQGASSPDRSILGSVAERVARDALRPVLIVSSESGSVDDGAATNWKFPPEKVAICIDAADARSDRVTAAAVATAAELARPHGAELFLLYVAEPPYTGPSLGDEEQKALREANERDEQARTDRMERWHTDLAGHGIMVTPKMLKRERGHSIASLINAWAVDEGVSLIAVGAHHRDSRTRVLGSVGSRIIRGLHVPVVVVHPARTSDAD